MISPQSKAIFDRILEALPSERREIISAVCDQLTAYARSTNKDSAFAGPAVYCQHQASELLNTSSVDDIGNALKSVVACLALTLPQRASSLELPQDSLALFPAAIDRMATRLASFDAADYTVDKDTFRKDIRFVLGLTIPSGAQVIDLLGAASLKSAVASIYRGRSVTPLVSYVFNGGTGPWFRIHTDADYLDEFNEPGWERLYARIAQLLEGRPNIRGMVGTSWFYDPQLVDISPRLAYLQQRPLERGAFLIPHATNPHDIEYATRTSKTRRARYEAGDYKPVSHSLLWPRAKLLDWAMD